MFKRWRLERLEVFDIILVKVKVRDPRLILQKIEETSKNRNQRREIYNRKIDFVEKFIRAKVIEPYRSHSFLAERNTLEENCYAIERNTAGQYKRGTSLSRNPAIFLKPNNRSPLSRFADRANPFNLPISRWNGRINSSSLPSEELSLAPLLRRWYVFLFVRVVYRFFGIYRAKCSREGSL